MNNTRETILKEWLRKGVRFSDMIQYDLLNGKLVKPLEHAMRILLNGKVVSDSDHLLVLQNVINDVSMTMMVDKNTLMLLNISEK